MKIRDDIELGQHSHVGMARTANEDFFGYWEPDDDREFDLKGRLVVVCDGMGGHTGGEIASRMAVKTIIEKYQLTTGEDVVENVRTCIEQANAAVYGESTHHPELRGMGTTVTVVVQRRDIVYFGQVGDSRAYLIRGGAMKQMTKDHSLVQQLVDEGLLDASEMETHPDKNVILRSLGVKAEVDVDVSHVPIVNNDVLLLCSDGLSGLVTDDQMLATVSSGLSNNGNLRKICEDLVNQANAAGGHDNITVQLLRIAKTDSATTDTTPPETVTQSFSEEEVAASIAKARAEAAAKKDTLPPPGTPIASDLGSSDSGFGSVSGSGSGNVMPATAPAMPIPKMEQPADSGGVGSGPFLVGGLIIGLIIGVGVGFASGGGGGQNPTTSGAVEAARSQAMEAGAEDADAFKEAAKLGDSLAAVEAYLKCAATANLSAATTERERAETLKDRCATSDSPHLSAALRKLTAGTIALQNKHYAEARAEFAEARALFEIIEGSK